MVKASPPSAGGVGVTPGQEASWPKNQNIKQKQYCNKFHKDFKMIHIKKKKKKKPVKPPSLQGPLQLLDRIPPQQTLLHWKKYHLLPSSKN